MLTKTYKFFNILTRQSILEDLKGYVSKAKSIEEEIVKLKKQEGLKEVIRFDLGENVDGFSPKINEFLERLYKNKVLFNKFNNYPEIAHLSLRKRLAAIFSIKREQIVVSAGLDSIIDLITRTFFDYNDIYLMPVPGFFLFEHYSERMGAIPLFLQLKEEDNFNITHEIVSSIKENIMKFRPKLVWLSTPNNPTGQIISDEILYEIIEFAYSYNVFVVVDEAYKEFLNPPKDSAAKFIDKFQNLMVLRSFSKALGLAGIRLGYLMCSSKDIIKALLLHRQHFPVTQLALHIARIATKDKPFLLESIEKTTMRRQYIFEKLDKLVTFKYIPSYTNIFIIKNINLTAEELHREFMKRGIVVAFLNITGIHEKNYLRVTIRNEEDNHYFCDKCKEIEDMITSIK